MKKIVLIVLFPMHFLLPAQEGKNYQIVQRSGSGNPSFIRFEPNADVTHSNFFEKLKTEFNFRAEDRLDLIEINVDKEGYTHFKYGQFYKDVKVVGAEYIIHEKEGKAVIANGKFVSTININVAPGISSDEAIAAAINFSGFTSFRWDNNAPDKKLYKYYPKSELIVAPFKGNYNSNDFRLCWKINVLGAQLHKAVTIFIDAHSGELVNTINLVHDQDAPATVATLYNGVKNVTSSYNSISGKYSLHENNTLGPWASQEINTFNANRNTLPSMGGSNGMYVMMNEIENVSSNFTNDSASASVHWAAEQTYNFYDSIFNRNSYDDLGSQLNSFAHYDTNLNNAFWAGYGDSLACMAFGDGDGIYMGPLVDIEIIGHEFSHGVTQHTSALDYSGESGALNESFSDIMGTAIKFFALGSSATWNVGDNTILIPPYKMRSMSNPNSGLFPQPDTYLGTYWKDPYDVSFDHGGVHYNSGIQNFWFYLLTVGGSGTNDNMNNYAVAGIGMADALKIVYRSQTIYLFSTASYYDAEMTSVQAATDLFGATSTQVQSVKDAWCAVGVSTCATPWSVDDIDNASEIHISPNPAKDNVTIVTKMQMGNMNISVVNVLGETVLTYTPLSEQSSVSLDLSTIESGVYFIRVDDKDNSISKKIIVQH